VSNRDIIAIGTSAGGVEALLLLARSFRPDFPAAVLVTIHLSQEYDSELDQMLTRAGPLPASFGQEGSEPRKAHIYLAPPGRHLLLEDDRLMLGNGPRENNARPAIDPMLRSVAMCCGGRAVGVVLTGAMGDGASGLWAIERAGGLTVVQDPRDAAFSEMPREAVNMMDPDHVVPLTRLPALLDSLVHRPAGETRPLPDQVRFEVAVARGAHSSADAMDQVGRRSVLTCPDCGGTMWEIEEAGLVRYRCHIGHAYSATLMELALDDKLRHALASARVSHRERVMLLERMERRAAASGWNHVAATWKERAEEHRTQAETIDGALRTLDRLAMHRGKRPRP
jgi:two-component system, chemotaxis family, protein-glutamate methylesterase/glutaminase